MIFELIVLYLVGAIVTLLVIIRHERNVFKDGSVKLSTTDYIIVLFWFIVLFIGLIHIIAKFLDRSINRTIMWFIRKRRSRELEEKWGDFRKEIEVLRGLMKLEPRTFVNFPRSDSPYVEYELRSRFSEMCKRFENEYIFQPTYNDDGSIAYLHVTRITPPTPMPTAPPQPLCVQEP